MNVALWHVVDNGHIQTPTNIHVRSYTTDSRIHHYNGNITFTPTACARAHTHTHARTPRARTHVHIIYSTHTHIYHSRVHIKHTDACAGSPAHTPHQNESCTHPHNIAIVRIDIHLKCWLSWYTGLPCTCCVFAQPHSKAGTCIHNTCVICPVFKYCAFNHPASTHISCRRKHFRCTRLCWKKRNDTPLMSPL